MGRNKSKRKIGTHTEHQMQNALDAIKAGKSIRQAAIEHKIPFSTLQRYNGKQYLHRFTPNYSVRKIFGTDHELALCQYFKKCALMFYGLTARDCRQIAYEMAKISAGGFALPPAFVFPRKNINPRMGVGTPPGSLILASPTGWMNTDTFVDVMKHFVQRSGSTKDSPTVLIMDNHESHLSIEALDLAKESGVTVLTLHPHTSARLQPLDVGIHGPFKSYYSSAMESWMMRNPGCPVTIYDIGALVGQAFEKSMTPVNIKNSFKKTGIYPFDRNIFSEEDFMPSSVTDRPITEEQTALLLNTSLNFPVSNDEAEDICNEIPIRDEDAPSPSVIDTFQDENTPSPSVIDTFQQYIIISSAQSASAASVSVPQNPLSLAFLSLAATNRSDNAIPLFSSLDKHLSHTHISSPSSIATQDSDEISSRSSHVKDNLSARIVTPDEFRKPIKATARRNNRKPRRLGKSLIATDTPEKEEIKKNKKAIKRKQVPQATKTRKKFIRKIFDTDSEEEYEIALEDESPDEGSWISEEENKNIITQETLSKPLPRMPREGEYVLIEFASKTQLLYYVAKVLEERNDALELYVSYLRYKKGYFSLPNIPDLAYVKDDNVKLLLPIPTSSGSTARQQSYLTFGVDLSGINIR